MSIRSWFFPSLRVALALSSASWFVTSTDAQVDFKLNGPLARSFREGFRMGDVRVSPDGEWVVYAAALDSEDAGLFTVRVDGSERPRRLVPVGTYFTFFDVSNEWVVVSDAAQVYRVPIDASRGPAPILRPRRRTIHALRISPDGSRVVYVAARDGGPRRLFSAATRGDPAPLRISGPPTGAWVFDFLIDPDGRRVVFTSDRDERGIVELYSTPIDGSSLPVKLNGPMRGAGIPFWSSPFQIGADGARVVYTADQDQRGVFELYGAPIDASSPARKLNGPMVSRGDVWSFVIAPDGSRVVYLADQEADERRELYSAPLDASSSAVKLNGSLVPDGDVMYSDYEISPDSKRVSYWAQEESLTLDLHVAPIDGGAPASQVNGALFGGSRFSPDGRRIVYRSGEYGDVALYSAPVGRGEIVDLTGSSGPYAWIYGHSITRDSVVFLEGPGDGRRIHRVSLLGGSAPVLLADVPRSSDLVLADGGRRVLFRASPTVDWLDEIFSVPVDGSSAPVALNDAPVTNLVTADVISVCTNPRGGRAAFVVRVPPGYDGYDDRVALYSAALEPRSRPIQLLPEISGDIDGCAIDATGQYVVFLARRNEDYGYELWSARLDGELPPVRLDAPTSFTGAFRLTPDGAQVIFDAYSDLGSELYAVPIGGGPVTELTEALPDDDQIVSFELSGDGRRVVLVSGRFSRDFQLFSAPVDGSTAPVRLNGALVAGGSVDSAFEISPDSRTVVYRADEAFDEVFELFAVAADGASAPVKISGTLVAGGDVQTGFRIGLDGRTVAFRADRSIDEVFELFAAPITGSSGPIKVSGTLVARGDVEPGFAFVPGGERIVFRADLAQDERFELYVAPLDGSAGPIRLSGSLVAGGDVVDAQVSPDGARVVYRADATVDERFELYGVPLDGSAPPIALAGPLPIGGDVLDRFEITPDGRRVVYAADADVNDVFDLFAAPLDREKAARRLDGPLVPGGDAVVFEHSNSPVASFAITADGRAVLYRGDQESDDVVELFLSSLEGPYQISAGKPR